MMIKWAYTSENVGTSDSDVCVNQNGTLGQQEQ